MRWLVIALCALSAACADVDAQQMEQNHYCKMVEQGAWPDYENKYKEWCK